jgi:GT2 family glycosyltransferase
LIRKCTTEIAEYSTPEQRDRTGQKVLLVCVKYDSDPETALYMESLRRLEGQPNLQVLIVDNAVGALMAAMPMDTSFTLLRSNENLGYFGGARWGISKYLEEHPLPDWVIVSNVDLLITDAQFLQKLAALNSAPHVGAVAPRIASALTGRNQNPFMRSRPSALRMQVYKWLYRSWLALNAHELASAVFHRIRSALRRFMGSGTDIARDVGEKIYAPHGSFLILSKEYFRAGGSLDFPCFLFGEEIYLAENLRRLNLDVIYEPSLEVVHQEHASTKLMKSRKLARFVASSAAYCADTYFPLKQAR